MQERTLADKPLEGLRVAILCATDFEQSEMTEPRKALQEAGAETILVSPQPGQVQGMKHDIKQDTFTVDMTLGEAQAAHFDALMLPGGGRGRQPSDQPPAERSSGLQSRDGSDVCALSGTDRPTADSGNRAGVRWSAGIRGG